jgi:RNA polymerase II subunit A C-terminal domain phosphatase SSU72
MGEKDAMNDDVDDEKKSYAMVCAANMNRSMAAHCALLEKGVLNVSSFGAGSSVKIPGSTKDDPNVYQFGKATYADIRKDLIRLDENAYRQKGLIDMLERNMRVKEKPERWQDNSDEKEFDVVVCFEERVFDLVLADMREKNAKGTPCLVINLDVRDSHEDAVNAAPMALKLCEMIEKCEDWECEIDEIIDQFEEEVGIKPLYSVCYY